VIRALLLLAVLVACDRKAAQPPAAATSEAVPKGFVIPKQTKQLVTAVVDDWSSTHARVTLWQRTISGWEPIGDQWPAVIGKAGSGWGIGVFPAGRSESDPLHLRPPGREGPTKKEGDMKSPAGVFAFRSLYGYAEDAPRGWRMPYDQSTDLECIDDAASEHYTKIVDRKQVPSDWQSAEQMRRDDALYEWVLDVAHNPDAKPGAGSCIFLHVWSGPESTTAGCTAMDKPKLENLLGKLDPANQPLYVLLPRSEYRLVAPVWGLPAQ
jgi:L,D-peptidoglycan transpeptidase YkuD (ErfK/YbiS/YcfS/YnhG family)